jgi:adenylate kinase
MKIRNAIVVLGPPGSGKGTQGKLLASVLGYSYLSMGQHLRDYSNKDSKLAANIKETIDSGHIIPDDWIRNIFRDAVENLPDADGIILDGFPRDLGQVPILEEFLKLHETKSLKVLFLQVNENDLVERIGDRRADNSGRADDNPKIISTRFEEYKLKTFPLKKYFEDQGVVITIDGNYPIEEVHQQILSKLGIVK